MIARSIRPARVALCATPAGRELAERLWGRQAIWIEYERPGFSLGKIIALAVHERPDATCVLMAKHGLVTWASTGEETYARTIDTIGRAAEALAEKADRRVFATTFDSSSVGRQALIKALPALRGAVSRQRPMVLRLDTSDRACAFVSRPDLAALAGAGPACPDHLVHTMPWPLVIPADATGGAAMLTEAFHVGVAAFEQRYQAYVARYARDGSAMRDPAPRVVLVPAWASSPPA